MARAGIFVFAVAFAYIFFFTQDLPLRTEDHTRWTRPEWSWPRMVAETVRPFPVGDLGYMDRPVYVLMVEGMHYVFQWRTPYYFLLRQLTFAFLILMFWRLARVHSPPAFALLFTLFYMTGPSLLDTTAWIDDFGVLANALILMFLIVLVKFVERLPSLSGWWLGVLMVELYAIALLANRTKGTAKYLVIILVCSAVASGMQTLKRLLPLLAGLVVASVPLSIAVYRRDDRVTLDWELLYRRLLDNPNFRKRLSRADWLNVTGPFSSLQFSPGSLAAALGPLLLFWGFVSGAILFLKSRRPISVIADDSEWRRRARFGLALGGSWFLGAIVVLALGPREDHLRHLDTVVLPASFLLAVCCGLAEDRFSGAARRMYRALCVAIVGLAIVANGLNAARVRGGSLRFEMAFDQARQFASRLAVTGAVYCEVRTYECPCPTRDARELPPWPTRASVADADPACAAMGLTGSGDWPKFPIYKEPVSPNVPHDREYLIFLPGPPGPPEPPVPNAKLLQSFDGITGSLFDRATAFAAGLLRISVPTLDVGVYRIR